MATDLLSTVKSSLEGNLNDLTIKLKEVKDNLQEKLEEGIQGMDEKISQVSQNIFGTNIKEEIVTTNHPWEQNASSSENELINQNNII
ncbi:MAG: hypothetical protein QWI36_00710 [Wolbachia endosymbiont of Tyrophagus putrescentiae]|nr:hypothetical protein [Wolbachia endosymbiont of Tyrophagus putrescentiae]